VNLIRLTGKDSFGAELDSVRGMGAVEPDGVITRPFQQARITNIVLTLLLTNKKRNR
jgi:hypothetical protein